MTDRFAGLVDGSTVGDAGMDGAASDSDDTALDAYSQVVTSVAAKVLPTVVSLRVMAPVTGGRRPIGSGSAVVVTPDGFLLTSAHVVARSSGGQATLADGRELPWELVGTDPLSDMAVIRVAVPSSGPGVQVALLGDADRLHVGQLVVAVGNPLGFAGSVSAGVVSGVGRSMTTSSGRTSRLVENVIQTDAALHPGNSGGALAISRGEVVGINTAVVGPGIGQGLGLAVPINTTTRQIIGALMRDGRVRRAYLGIAGGSRPLPPRSAAALNREKGLEVVSVVVGSPAAAAQLRPEDIIVSVDGVAVSDVGDLQRLMTGERVGQTVTLQVVRAGTLTKVDVRPTELDG
jgi:S1-C subfamily serine protease